MDKVISFVMVILFFSTMLSGCTALENNTNSNSDNVIDVPTWEIGENWLYTFTTPEYSDDTAKLVVASDNEEEGTAYMLTISSLTEARRHAVLNHNPFLGRMTHSDLSTYENGVPQLVMDFPLELSKSWTYTLFDMEWNANVISINQNIAVIQASSDEGSKLVYSYDTEIEFFRMFTWTDNENIEQLKMIFVEKGDIYSGDVYFVRGGDLYSNTWQSNGPDIEIEDSFLVSNHPNDGEWDEMIYFLDAECGSGSSSITLTLRDHLSATALFRAYGPGSSELGTLGTIPYPTEEYTLTATLTGDSMLRLIFAGGITQSWTL
ncbi:MAG: hypothetical protein CND89_00340 [Marine Group II euryarchaeote MED-G38]|nr:MAG: hypothetical protein CBC57_04570 [Euryarchaeota archaeon TMED97]PDH23810.1 MAG: hypothetical protein CND89_00340 [Marine Group II euryarchaeote MED-G38]